MSTCNVCKKDLREDEMTEAVLVVNEQQTAIVADIHAISGSPAHPEGLRGAGGPIVQDTDHWEWRILADI